MKPCFVCKQPKTWHEEYNFLYSDKENHPYQPDNLAYLERQLKLKEARDKAHRLNFCQICKTKRKSPFGICQSCSITFIVENIKRLQESK